jgi:hypothetical protein
MSQKTFRPAVVFVDAINWMMTWWLTRSAAPVRADKRKHAMLDAVPLCALQRRTDVVGTNSTRQLSLQPEAPGADQEVTNGPKHFGKRLPFGGQRAIWAAAKANTVSTQQGKSVPATTVGNRMVSTASPARVSAG